MLLKTPQERQLLTAIGWDPNDQMLPIAYAVVEADTKDSWTWFLNHLVSDLGIENMGRSTFMSDQQKGLLPVYEDVILGVDNQFCVRHLYNNFRKRRWQMSGILCVHAIISIKFKGLDLEPFVADCYKKEAYLKCYKSVIHPLNGPDLWERTSHHDVMPLPYRRPSHRPVKKRKPATREKEQSNHTHLSRKVEKLRCLICGSVGHNKNRCPKPIEDEAQHSKKLSKGKQKKESTKSHPPAAKGGRKIASSQPTPKLSVKRKAISTTQLPSLAQSNSATQPKRLRGNH
ncbi:uncharacterized protein LOC130981257 [Arachis stenosperma]|uniref:uncharacterized protein LOC130981257 n=1 Tax=Arachis stenosperma TaxID=217475 RepID=UPI0025AD6F9E|nr:uncharacterized protein LOC130981257 [Arachis stenosperma]